MTEGDPELFQVHLGEMWQHHEVDIGLREGRAVLAQPKSPQPLHDGLHRGHAYPLEAWVVSTEPGAGRRKARVHSPGAFSPPRAQAQSIG